MRQVLKKRGTDFCIPENALEVEQWFYYIVYFLKFLSKSDRQIDIRNEKKKMTHQRNWPPFFIFGFPNFFFLQLNNCPPQHTADGMQQQDVIFFFSLSLPLLSLAPLLLSTCCLHVLLLLLLLKMSHTSALQARRKWGWGGVEMGGRSCCTTHSFPDKKKEKLRFIATIS